MYSKKFCHTVNVSKLENHVSGRDSTHRVAAELGVADGTAIGRGVFNAVEKGESLRERVEREAARGDAVALSFLQGGVSCCDAGVFGWDGGRGHGEGQDGEKVVGELHFGLCGGWDGLGVRFLLVDGRLRCWDSVRDGLPGLDSLYFCRGHRTPENQLLAGRLLCVLDLPDLSTPRLLSRCMTQLYQRRDLQS